MEITIDMPMVTQCQVSDCTYNVELACHARAITIGDGVHPGCDTYLNVNAHIRERQRIAGVGACKVSGCTHNEDFECCASDIRVGFKDGNIGCLTYSAR
jgi:hypothetical protein